MQNILVCGDSFSADWSAKYPGCKGWPNLLAGQYQVTNLSQAGCSEYKIWLQLASANLAQFDVIIVSHTSPYRIPIEHHPVHYSDPLHKNCDLIFSDIEQSNNVDLQHIATYFKKFFMPDYAIFTHNLIIKHEIQYLQQHFQGQVLHTTIFQQDLEFVGHSYVSFEHVFNDHKGLINHVSDHGNQIIFNKLETTLDNYTQ